MQRTLLTALVGLAVGALGLGSAAVAQDKWDLAILTPHNDHIQKEFEYAFSQHVGRELRIRWVKQGTGQLLEMLSRTDRNGETFGFDVFFGGGVPDLQLAAQRGYLEKPNLPQETLDAIPAEIAGVANVDPQGLWYGSALSSFGILINTRGLQNQGLPPITTWKDLSDPRMNSWVILADPRNSSSVRVSYELLLQQYGWEEGWPLLMQIAANARQFASSSSQIPNDVAIGNVLAGPCIDCYAWGRMAQTETGTLSFILPVGGSAITPDPIALLRKAPRRELAEQFIAFVLSPAGQKLWLLDPGTPGGPREHALYRLPIRRDVYPADGPLAERNPYNVAESALKIDDQLQNARTKLLAELMGVALVDQHADLRRAWTALIDGGMKPAAVEEWRKLPFSQEESLQLAKVLDEGAAPRSAAAREATRLVRGWHEVFRQKYRRVIELSR